MKSILDKLARSGLLYDDDMVAEILAGKVPPLEDIVSMVVDTALDAEATVRNDAQSTWNERRIARSCLAIAFLSAIACTTEREIAP